MTTVINTVNNEQVGPLLEFVVQNSDKMGAISFQPVSFTGRDEEISDEERHKQRYTISHLARDLQEYTGGKVDMYRDWYPLGSAGAYTWLADHLRGIALGSRSPTPPGGQRPLFCCREDRKRPGTARRGSRPDAAESSG